VEVLFPDGTRVRALALRERREKDDQRDYGLYMDLRWNPTWSADVIDWDDFGVPRDSEVAARQISSAFERAQAGQRVEIGCAGGLGRTGTVLACMAILSGVPEEEVVEWVRANYRVEAIETAEQEAWIQWFADRATSKER
jgi:protein-tyrosine phosphatase